MVTVDRAAVINALTTSVDVVDDRIITLGHCRVRIVTDRPSPGIFARFADHGPGGATAADVELWCLSRQPDRWRDVRRRTEDMDRTARARGFATGYYATDHFGEPVTVVSDDWRSVVVGAELDDVVWSYFVKYFLLRHSLAHSSVFLKASAVELSGRGVLILGPGSAGKTTLAVALAEHSGTFITNSHGLLAGGGIEGVATTVRTRERSAGNGDAPFERLLDPFACLPRTSPRLEQVDVVCVAAHSGRHRFDVGELDIASTAEFAMQFGLGLNVYRLEEDLLALVDGDVVRFGAAHLRMRSELADACATAGSRLRVDIDINDADAVPRLASIIEGVPVRRP